MQGLGQAAEDPSEITLRYPTGHADFADCADFNHRFPAGRALGCGWGSFFGLTGIEGLIIMKK